MRISNFGYQDLSFKLNFPVTESSVFSLWGTGLIDKNYDKLERYPEEWDSSIDRMYIEGSQYMGVAGVGYKHFLKNGAQIKSTLGIVFSDNDLKTDTISEWYILSPSLNLQNRNCNFIANTSYNHKLSSRHTNKTGITWTTFLYDMSLNDLNMTTEREKGATSLISLFTNSLIDVNKQITASIGLNGLLFTLNDTWVLGPRLSLDWKMSPRHSLGLGYGLESRMERLATYFIKSVNPDKEFSNKGLDFIKMHQFLLSYKWKMSEMTQLKIEPYFQYLFDVSIIPETNYSTLNGLSFILNTPLKSD